MWINSSALDLLVHMDFPVRDISEAVERDTDIHSLLLSGMSVVGLNPTLGS